MDDSPGLPHPAGRLQHAFVWLVFAAVCCMFVLQHHLSAEMEKPQGDPSKLREPPDLELLIQCRGVVGAKSWADSHPGINGVPKHFDDTIRYLVKTETDRLCLVPLFAELYGRNRAVAELNAIALPGDYPGPLRDVVKAFRTIYDADGELSDTQVAQMRRQMGWFGDLAVSHATGRNAEYIAVMNSARWVAVAQVVATGLVILGATVGLGLLIMFLVLRASGRWHNNFSSAPEDIPGERLPFLELAAVGLASMLVVPGILLAIRVPTLIAFAVVGIVFAWPTVRRFDWNQTCRILGFHSGRGVLKEIGCGLLGYVAGIPLILVCTQISKILAARFGENPTHPIVERIRNGEVSAVATMLVLACFLVPILEEGIFRGALYAYVRRYRGVMISTILTGLIFAAVHPQGWTAIPTLCAIGFVFAMIREWRGSLVAPIVAHSLNNSFSLGLICIMLLG